MAAYAAASKVDSFAEMPALNLGQAMTTVIDNMRLHMGNVICLLSGLLLGPVQGVLVGE